MSNDLLDKARIILRVSSTAFDEEIKMLMNGAKLDLEESGIDVSIEDDIIDTAIILFVKSNFGYDNLDSEKQLRAYERLKRKLSLATRWDKKGEDK